MYNISYCIVKSKKINRYNIALVKCLQATNLLQINKYTIIWIIDSKITDLNVAYDNMTVPYTKEYNNAPNIGRLRIPVHVGIVSRPEIIRGIREHCLSKGFVFLVSVPVIKVNVLTTYTTDCR